MPKQKREKFEAEETLRAVVLADSFNSRFHPLTADRPRVLLPLANIPIINYTLDCLLNSNVEEIYIICHAFGEQIQDHVDAQYSSQKVKIQVLMANEATSIGDCLRYVEDINVIEDGSTFVLMHGDVVSNVNLSPIIEAHKLRYEKNKSNIMTMVLKKIGPAHKMRTPEAEIAVALADDLRLLAYVDQSEPKVQFPIEIFQDHDQVECRADVIDSHIYVCSKEVLNFFKDEFDVQDMFAGIKFIHTDQIYCHRIYAAIADREYAARATDIHCYDAISKDIINRWTYPLVPDVFCEGGSSPAFPKRYNIYLSDDVLLTRGCLIEENTLVGEGTQIGRESAATSFITNSIIGKDCTIGAGVHMDNVYLFDNVVVEDGCRLQQTVIGANVKIYQGATIGKRCVLGHNTVVGAGACIPEDTVITDLDIGDDEDAFSDSESDSEDEESDEILGEGGRGKVVSLEKDGDDEDGTVRYGWAASASRLDAAENEDPYETEDDSDDEQGAGSAMPADPFEGFLDAMIDLIVERVVLSNVDAAPLDELRLETRSNRAAYNMSMLEVVLGLCEAIVKGMDELGDLTKGQYAGKLKNIFVKLAPLFVTYVKEIAPVEFVIAIEDACFLNDNAMASFQTVVHALYEDDNELITEESMLAWFNSSEDDLEEHSVAKHKTLKAQAKPFIDWLQTASSEEDSDDD